MNEPRPPLWSPASDRVLSLLTFVVPLASYLATLAPTVLSDDSGEFQLVTNALGVAHPTGYPLLTLLGYVFAHLAPLGDPAFRINLLSALCAAGALFVTFRLLRELEITPLVASLSVLGLAYSTDFWNFATSARAYALNWLLLALVLFQFVRWSRVPTRQNFVGLALLYGLSLTHHSTMLFFAPALAAGILVVLRRQPLDVTPFGLGGLAFALPLLLYLYIPLRAEALLRDPSLAGSVLDIPRAVVDGLVTPHYLAGPANVVLASFYATKIVGGGTFNVPDALVAYLAHWATQFTWLGVVLAVIGLGVLSRRSIALCVVIGLAWLADVLVVSIAIAAYGEGPELFTPSWLLAVVCLAACADAMVGRKRIWTLTTLLALVFVVLAGVWQNAPAMLQRHQDSRDAEFARSTLNAALPEGSVILGAWSQVTPLHYVQVIEGVRRDVAVIQAPLAAPEGRALMNRALDEARPLYVLNASNALVAIPLREPPAMDATVGVTFGHELTLVGYRARSPQLELFWRAETTPAADYAVFVHLVDGRGEQINTPDQPPATEFFPTSLWRAGQTFGDVHVLPALDGVKMAEVGVYNPASGKRLALPDGATTLPVRLK